MAIKDLAVAFNGSVNSEAGLSFAVQMCKKYDAVLTGVHVRPPLNLEPQVRRWTSQSVLESLRQAGDEAVKATETDFRETVAAAGFHGPTEWLVVEGHINDTLAHIARYHDILVIGQFSEAGEKRARVRAEDLVQHSGRPLIIVPNGYEVRPFTEYAAVAWDGSRPAARALADAMQILETKKRLDVVRVGAGKKVAPGNKATGQDIVAHLKRHGIAAQAVTLTATRDRVGETILEYCDKNQPDVLVMGAYGHAQLREDLFGGVTRYILQNTTVPVLMAH